MSKWIKTANYRSDMPSYQTPGLEALIQRYGSLPSMRRWVVTVGSYQLPGSYRTLREAKAAAEAELSDS